MIARSAIAALCLILSGCGYGPDPSEICEAALQGIHDRDRSLYHSCTNDVWRAEFRAGHEAAQRYRDMKRAGA